MSTHSRRSVLGHIALAGVTASLVRPAKGATYDPVFEAIEAHRKARADVRAACAESDRLCDLADRIAGKHEVILPDFSMAQCYYDIEAYFPGDENKDLRAAYVKKLEERQAARDAVYGDIDAVVGGPCCYRMRRNRCPGGDCANDASGSARLAGLPGGSPPGRPGTDLRSSYRAVDR